MNRFYHKRLEKPIGLALVDLVVIEAKGMLITRINVPKDHRGKGIGSELLNEVLLEADKRFVTLYLEVLASGGLTRKQLIEWYQRNDFVKGEKGLFVRPPQSIKRKGTSNAEK